MTPELLRLVEEVALHHECIRLGTWRHGIAGPCNLVCYDGDSEVIAEYEDDGMTFKSCAARNCAVHEYCRACRALARVREILG